MRVGNGANERAPCVAVVCALFDRARYYHEESNLHLAVGGLLVAVF